MSKMNITEMLNKLHENEVVELSEDDNENEEQEKEQEQEQEQEEQEKEQEQEQEQEEYDVEKYFNDIEEEKEQQMTTKKTKLLKMLDSETDEEDTHINIEKPKKIKSKSQFKKYKNDKKVIQEVIKLVKKLMREFKFNVRKYLKLYNNTDLDDEDKEDMIDEHNSLKQQFLNEIYTLEDQSEQNDIKLPEELYKMIDKMFETEKMRIIKVIN
jgi:hypothetical protein